MECPICGKIVSREYMEFTRDCHGIPFRLVCVDCYDKIMDGDGYDGQRYDENDENIDDYY